MSHAQTDDHISRRMVLAGIAASVSLLPLGAESTPSDPIILTAAPARWRLRPDPAPETNVLAYNGQIPGPILRLRRGEARTIRLVNSLKEPTSLHIAGLRHANAADGVAGLTQAAVQPGAQFETTILTQDAGTFLYHPMVIGKTADQLERGLAGMLIVEDDWGPVDHDVALLLDDWKLTQEGEISDTKPNAGEAARLGRLGNALTVNGKPAPERITIRPNARIRLRIAGAMNARILPLRFQNMAKATVIAIDGQPCDPFDPLKRQVIVAPGSRYDVALDAPALAGQSMLVQIDLGSELTILQLATEGEALPQRPPVTPLPSNPNLPPAIRLQNARRAEFNIAGGWDVKNPAGPGADAGVVSRAFPDASKIWTLNFGFPSGITGKPLFSVKKGQEVVVALVNRTGWTQTLRVHGHVFRVLHALDDGWEPFFLDTVIVPENRTVRIAFIADNVGKWLIRSAVAEHMESGVLSWFEVSP